ncbi:hypothetical protein BGW38_009564 [Lunasporangiospora selenospora]|uniref:Transmembrane protein n=1 Tax=Lunasporangiospora selenospora TaxID=979761 RepID=A0A9P6G246_9FUNG|nr:hypothetical protein BGW38_009564 [Lunasporangiospora selenospora]
MSDSIPHCVASNAARIYIIYFYPLDLTGPISVDPLTAAFKRRVVLAQTQERPSTPSSIQWSLPAISSSSLSSANLGELDALFGDFALGTSSCQVDMFGNFVWITSQSVTSTPDGTRQSIPKPRGIMFSVKDGWSFVETFAEGEATYQWSNQTFSSSLFSTTQSRFFHSLIPVGSSNILFGSLSDKILKQGPRAWTPKLDAGATPVVFGSSSQVLFLIDSQKHARSYPMTGLVTNATEMIGFLETVPFAVNGTGILKIDNLPDECVDPSRNRLHSAMVEATIYLLCAPTTLTATAPRLLYTNGTDFAGPFDIPLRSSPAKIASFAATSAGASGEHLLFITMGSETIGLVVSKAGPRPDSTSFTHGTISEIVKGTVPSSSPTSYGDSYDSKQRLAPMSIGIVAGVILIATLVYCCFFRRKRSNAKIQRIFQQNEHPILLEPVQAHPAGTTYQSPTHMTVGIAPAPFQQHGAHSEDIVSSEEQDLAQIELQRQKLPPPPTAIYGTIQPLAPPSTIEVLPELSPKTKAATAKETSPVLGHLNKYQHSPSLSSSSYSPSAPHSPMQHHQPSRAYSPPQPPYAPNHSSPQQPASLHEGYGYHPNLSRVRDKQRMELDTDFIHTQPYTSGPPSGSSTAALMSQSWERSSGEEEPKYHAGTYGDDSGQRGSSSQRNDHSPMDNHSHHGRDKIKGEQGWEEEEPIMAAPPPPPYLERAAYQLTAPSAPSPEADGFLERPPVPPKDQ